MVIGGQECEYHKLKQPWSSIKQTIRLYSPINHNVPTNWKCLHMNHHEHCDA